MRTNPTAQEIIRGEALNALLIDLSNPAITSSAWRLAQVSLPDGLSIRSLFFRFSPKLGDQTSKLNSNLIALGRLDPEKGWPPFIPEDVLGPERHAYEAAYRDLLELCGQDKLTLAAVERLEAALAALKAKTETAVPTARSFRSEALRVIGDMKEATQIFDAKTIDFAQEMIRDTHDYNLQTVGELLAFMRKYRLLFASAEGRPGDGETNRQLYDLLRYQKEKLNLPASAMPSGNPQTIRAIDVLLIHLKDIATNQLPIVKQVANSRDKKAIIDKLTAEATAIIEQVSNMQPLSDRNLLALNQLIRDLRFAIENPDRQVRIQNGASVMHIKSVIRTLETDLRDIQQTQR